MAAKDELLKCEIATKLSKSLAYFLHYVISKPILERVRRVAILKKLQESKPSTWRELSTAVLWELREESALKRLALSLSQTRKEPLHDWLSICVVARAEFIKADVSLPEREWAVYATRQMYQAELAKYLASIPSQQYTKRSIFHLCISSQQLQASRAQWQPSSSASQNARNIANYLIIPMRQLLQRLKRAWYNK